MKAMLRGNFIALSPHIKNSKKSHTSSLTAQLKALEQKETKKHPREVASRNNQTQGLKNNIERKRTIQRINGTKNWLRKSAR